MGDSRQPANLLHICSPRAGAESELCDAAVQIPPRRGGDAALVVAPRRSLLPSLSPLGLFKGFIKESFVVFSWEGLVEMSSLSF